MSQKCNQFEIHNKQTKKTIKKKVLLNRQLKQFNKKMELDEGDPRKRQPFRHFWGSFFFFRFTLV
jgi:hypothetical protein